MREMGPERVYEMMPDRAMKQGCAECYMKEFGQKMPAAEMQRVGEMETRMRFMEGVISEYRRRDFDASLSRAVEAPFESWNVQTIEHKTMVQTLKDNLKVQLVAQMLGSTKESDIPPAFERAWDLFKPMAEMAKAAMQGPSAFVGGQQTGGPGQSRQQSGKLADPEVAKRDRAALSF
jgi:hypothetical protein